MKDENGIEIKCENCDDFIPVGTNGRGCTLYEEDCENVFGEKRCIFKASREAYEARIAELQEELEIIKEPSEPSESFYQRYSGVSEEYALGALEQCATEADELQARVKDLENKLTETVKLLSERSRECGELEAHNEVLQRRIEEFSMELLDRTMKENKDVLERLKEAESEEK